MSKDNAIPALKKGFKNPISDVQRDILAPGSDTQRDIWARGIALMEAAMFVWCDGAFEWEHIEEAARIFSSHADQLPRDLNALVQRIPDEGIAARKTAMRALTWDGARYKITYQFTRYDGEVIWIEECGQRIRGEGKQPSEIVGVIRDIQSYKLAEQKVVYNARHDALSALWNLERMEEGLTHVIAASQRYERPACFINVQVLNLSDINTTYGYEIGNQLISKIADRLKAHLRAPDMIARTAGNIFSICMCDCSPQAASVLAERLSTLLTDTPYQSPAGDLYAEMGFGSVQLPSQAGTPFLAMQMANIALEHSAKRQGAYVPFSSGLAEIKPSRRQSDMEESDVLDALNSRRIMLAYQPVVHSGTREPHHYECLLRLRRADGEVVPAGEFIMTAERLGLVHLLDRRALELASETLRDAPDIRLALNISAATAKDEQTAADYITALKTLGQDTQRVIIELTETVAIDDPAMAAQFSNSVRALGCTFSIDDFGAGYTTFQNLMAIEADEIKIDGSFIRDLSTTPHKQTFVRMMVDLAQTFSVKTVAEFVNTREDAELLTRLGVDYLQGYMFGVPSTKPNWPSRKTDQASAAE